MISALSSLFGLATSGLSANASRLDVIADNMANANTSGFKAALTQFGEAMSPPETREGNPVSSGQGTLLQDSSWHFGQGVIQPSDEAWHLAIDGPGLFRIRLPDGTLAYTRDGRFHPDENGALVTASGYALSPGIVLPQGATALLVNADGTVLAGDGVSEMAVIGQITLSAFPNPGGLARVGYGLYVPTAASGLPVNATAGQPIVGDIVGRTLESSNVSLVDQMAELVMARRAYAVAGRLLTTVDEMANLAEELIT